MKKVVLSAVLGMFAFTAVSAEDVVVSEGTATACENTFDGFYFGLGMGGSFLKNKANATTAANVNLDVKKQNVNRFMGSIVFGAGKTFKEKFYVGAEGLIDFMKSKTTKADTNSSNAGIQTAVRAISVRNRGVTPELALRLGFVKADWNTMFYAKVAGAFPKTTLRNDGRDAGSVSKMTPAIALGVEKAFCKKFSARLEGEYMFRTNKTFNVGGNNVKLKANEGFNLRALVSYNVKF